VMQGISSGDTWRQRHRMIVSTKLTKHSHYPAGIPAGFFYARNERDRSPEGQAEKGSG
jgi:hypothetical protein